MQAALRSVWRSGRAAAAAALHSSSGGPRGAAAVSGGAGGGAATGWAAVGAAAPRGAAAPYGGGRTLPRPLWGGSAALFGGGGGGGSAVPVRAFVASPVVRVPIEDFFTTYKDPKDTNPLKAGRQWEAKHLRGKSFDDLHKLWYVLLKEQNALSTEQYHAKKAGVRMEAPHRLTMVRKAMNRIKLVLTERAIAEAGDNEDQRKLMMRIINGPPHGHHIAHRHRSYARDPAAPKLKRLRKPHIYRRPYKFELKKRTNKRTVIKGMA